MLHLLREAERALPELLLDRASWNGLHIDYEHPHVDRLWIPWKNDTRINLHRIYPCSEAQAFIHPHPWPSAVLILEGRYEMIMGHILPHDDEAGPLQAVEATATIILEENSRYEMANRWGTHSVRPLDGPSLSLMITGKPWDKEGGRPLIHGPSKDQRALHPDERESLFSHIRKHYYQRRA